MFVIRIARQDDLDAISEVCSAALTSDLDDAGSLPALLWDSPATRPQLRLVAETAGRIVGVALGALRIPPGGPPTGHVDLLAVAPEVQGAGIGRTLLAALEHALRIAGAGEARVGGNAPCYAWPGVDATYTAALGLVESAGYERSREAVNMTVDLRGVALDTTADERRLMGHGIAVRPLASSDEPGFSSWVTDSWSLQWAWEATRALVRPGAGCHIAHRGPDFVGFAAYGSNRPSWFGPMATSPAEQRLGLGRVLLFRCLADQLDAGVTQATIAWVGPADFYRHVLGAEVDRVFRQYRKAL
ncbi:MAG TPA: N-acetyltransferase [Acidimicrobiales bacterium]|nr:N-acetyltransferase [Acidimicrobiales bacterium]